MPFSAQPFLRGLLWCVPIIGILAYQAVVRVNEGTPATPFLLCYAGVVIASFGGLRAGLMAGMFAAGFVVHSYSVGFGPRFMIGDPVQLVFGCSIYLASGYALGRRQEQNGELIEQLEMARSGLEERVAERTNELEIAASRLEREVAEREAIAEELSAAERRGRHDQRLESIGVLAGGIAHEFNNLLTAIIGNASLLRANLRNRPNAATPLTLLSEIDEAGGRAADLVRQMLAYAGESHEEWKPVDVRALLEEMLMFVRASTTPKVRFELDCDPGLSTMAEPSQLSQAFVNLLLNATEATEGAGRVRISVRVGRLDESKAMKLVVGEAFGTEPQLLITVEDEGMGIPEERIERILDPFYTTKFTGRGLGLAVVFGAVRAHEGGLTVESQVGYGSRFTLVLPHVKVESVKVESVAIESVEPERVESPSEESARESKTRFHARDSEDFREGSDARPAAVRSGQRILVADDEPGVRRIAVRILESEGWDVVEVSDGLEAIDRCEKDPRIVLAMIDVTMPVMDGYEAIEMLRVRRPDLPVILMSGYGAKAGQPGTLPFICKPYSRSAVLEAVAGALSS